LILVGFALLGSACGDDDSAADGGSRNGGTGGRGGAAADGGSKSDAGSNSDAGRAGGATGAGGRAGGGGGRAGGGASGAGTGGKGGTTGGGSSGSYSSSCWAKPLFGNDLPWNQSIENAPKDSQSDTIIPALQKRGWGAGRLQIDYSIDVLCAPTSTPLRPFEKTDNFFDGECNDDPVPVPTGGHVEGEDGYECTGGGDCHLIVIKEDTHKLYEQWVASIDSQDEYTGGCLAVWDMNRSYPATLRGDQCSSADAAGLPIAPLLFDADEVAAGEIKHAVRFALPNTHLRKGTYVRPATHATNSASAGADGVPYGARLRLRASYPVDSLPNEGAKVLARALQRYGMIMADGGNIALMGQDDRSTTHKWDGLLAPRDLQAIKPEDFEMVEAGERFTWKGDCTLAE
jgi:serine/threonine-protein kinase